MPTIGHGTSFRASYQGKKVLVTGHTGFKGSWLTAWLIGLGANVVGVSKNVPTRPSMFEELGLAAAIVHYQADIRDLGALRDIFSKEKPDFVFHLAAQAIVSTSYVDPMETMTSNVVGTMNVLEVLRFVDWPCAAVLITSDKCYDNVEWVWGYRETDRLGGKDIYSGSKGAAELVIKSYVHSFFTGNHPVRLAVGRAGNVIGGGDWAKDRIVADAVRAWSKGEPVEIRSPNATRPWQHVLEPLSGYLLLGQMLVRNQDLHGEAFNFGPKSEQNRTVAQLLLDMAKVWGLSERERIYRVAQAVSFHEAGLLKLNCDKALFHLDWQPTLDYREAVQMVGEWYVGFYEQRADMLSLTMEQIAHYEQLGRRRARVWARA